MLTVAFVLHVNHVLPCNTNCAAVYCTLLSYRLVMLFCIGALMLNPALFKLTKPTVGLRQAWFQIITMFLLCFVEDDRPCLDGLQGRIQVWAESAPAPFLTAKSCKFSRFWGYISYSAPLYQHSAPSFHKS